MIEVEKDEATIDWQCTIDMKVEEAHKLIKECEKIADEHKLSFRWSLAYGMGGFYSGDPAERAEYETEQGWISSSSNC